MPRKSRRKMRASWAALEGSTCGPGSPGRGHFETFNLFSSHQHFFQLFHSAQCLILTTVALKLPPQSPRKERMRIKRNNYPFWPSQDLWTVFFVWCLKVVFPLFAEFMWTRWIQKTLWMGCSWWSIGSVQVVFLIWSSSTFWRQHFKPNNYLYFF